MDTEPEVVLQKDTQRRASVQSEPQCGCGSSYLDKRSDDFKWRNSCFHEFMERSKKEIGTRI